MTIKAGFCKPAQLSIGVQTACASQVERKKCVACLLRRNKHMLRWVGYRLVANIIQGYGDGNLPQLFIKYKAALICRHTYSPKSINYS
jgi:hypothetical protein